MIGLMIGYLMRVGHHQRRKVLQQQFVERDGIGSIQRSTLEREHRMPSHHDRDGGARTESTCRDASWHSKLAAPTFRCSVASRPIPFESNANLQSIHGALSHPIGTVHWCCSYWRDERQHEREQSQQLTSNVGLWIEQQIGASREHAREM